VALSPARILGGVYNLLSYFHEFERSSLLIRTSEGKLRWAINKWTDAEPARWNPELSQAPEPSLDATQGNPGQVHALEASLNTTLWSQDPAQDPERNLEALWNMDSSHAPEASLDAVNWDFDLVQAPGGDLETAQWDPMAWSLPARPSPKIISKPSKEQHASAPNLGRGAGAPGHYQLRLATSTLGIGPQGSMASAYVQ
jgi:hypothetical protein